MACSPPENVAAERQMFLLTSFVLSPVWFQKLLFGVRAAAKSSPALTTMPLFRAAMTVTKLFALPFGMLIPLGRLQNAIVPAPPDGLQTIVSPGPAFESAVVKAEGVVTVVAPPGGVSLSLTNHSANDGNVISPVATDFNIVPCLLEGLFWPACQASAVCAALARGRKARRLPSSGRQEIPSDDQD